MNFEPYLETIRDRIRNETEFPTWDWTRGGCFAFAEKFAKIIGGKEWGICEFDSDSRDFGSGDYPTYHAIVKYKGKFWDAQGEVDFKYWKREFPEMVIKPKTDSDIGWFEDDWLNDKEWKTMNIILKSLKEQFMKGLENEKAN